jgi:hypothetical protein
MRTGANQPLAYQAEPAAGVLELLKQLPAIGAPRIGTVIRNQGLLRRDRRGVNSV